MKRKLWTKEHLSILSEKYADNPTKVLATEMGRTETSVYAQAFLQGLKKSEEYLKTEACGRLQVGGNNGIAYRFKKGQTPPNKGKKMTPELYAKCQATMFKKGQMPHNAKPDKYERTVVDGYILVRVSASKFALKHRLVWESTYGAIPPGHVVAFKDGNKHNCDINNLQLLTFKENMARNSIVNYPTEIHSAIKILSKLNKTINEKQNERLA